MAGNSVSIILLTNVLFSTALTSAGDELDNAELCKGVTKIIRNPCLTCDRCNNGTWECDPVDCSEFQCADGYTEPNRCCNVCPNGPNCLAFGVIIPAGETVKIGSTLSCTCAYDGDNNYGNLYPHCR